MEKRPVNPFVYWAQSNEQLFLRLELEAKGTPQVTTSARRFEFSCRGVAPGHGVQDFEVLLDLQDAIVAGPAGYRMVCLGSRIQFYIDKDPDHRGFWPSLLQNRAKPAWLKLDFDRFQSGDADSDDEKDKDKAGGEDRSMRDTVDNLLREAKKKRPEGGPAPLDFKKMYLSTYNTFMLLGFAGVLVSLFRSYQAEGLAESIPKAYERVGQNVRFLQFAQTLEIVHAAVGLVHSRPASAVWQAVGRLTLVHLIHFQPELHNSPLVFWLYVTWASVEMIRYPYYLGQVHGLVPKPLKVLRYTSWMVLYPVGMSLEVLIILRALETYPESHPATLLEVAGHKLTISHIIGAYLLLCPFAFLFLLRHMFDQTKSQLFGKKKITRSKKVK